MSARRHDDAHDPGSPHRDTRHDPGQDTGHRSGQAGIPDDARRMGLDRNTEEGALVAMAGSLTPAKHSHRMIAWLLIAALVGPLLLGLASQLL